METSYEMRIVSHALKSCGYYPLRAMQRWLVDTHFNKTNSTMMNIGALFRLSPEVDLNRLAKAISDVLNTYDIFRARLVFHPETNDLCQRFDGEIMPVTVEKISDEEFAERKKNLMEPYKLIDKPLYRIYLFETPTAKYLYGDFYHAMLDGTAAVMLFIHEIDIRYKGKKITREPIKYSEYILEELKVSPEELAEGNEFWRETLKGFDETKHLPPSDVKKATAWNQESLIVPLKNITQKYFSNCVRKENIFFLAASMLTIAKSSGSKNSIMSWLHNGRYSARERRLMGITIEQFPISWNFEDDITVENFLDGLERKVNTGFKYRRSLGAVYDEGLEDECATFIFQKKVLGAFNTISLGGYPAEAVALPSNEWSAAENALDIEINLTADGYVIELDHDASRYSEESMKKFAVDFDEIILKMQDENNFVSQILERVK